MVTFYVTVVYSKLEIDLHKILLTRLQSLCEFYQFLDECYCFWIVLWNFIMCMDLCTHQEVILFNPGMRGKGK